MLRSDGVDGVAVFLEQFAHAVGLVQWVELFLGHLFELFDESRRALQTASLMALNAWGFWSLLLWFWNRRQL
jgi:hypothetical protein